MKTSITARESVRGVFCFFSIAFALVAIAFSQGAGAQCVSLTALNSAYTQNFDTLSNTAGSTTNNLTIPGWFMTESGGGARDNEQYAVDTGGSTTGDTYSYGATGSTERALGALRSGTLIPVFGACFTNNTGNAITSLDVAYTGEEWRLGTAARTDQLNFEYSINATDLVTGTYTGVAALNFVTPDTATTGAKNGNAAADRTALAASISSLNIPNGATFWIRWIDTDATGADDGLAVDDFSLTPRNATPPSGAGSASPNSVVQGGTTTLTINVTPGTNAVAGVTANLSSIGDANPATFTNAGGNTWTYNATVAVATSAGAKSLPFTVTDSAALTGGGNISLTVIALSTPPSGSGSANPSTVGQGGTTTLTVTVTPGSNAVSGVTADLSSIGDANPATFTNTSGNTWTYNATVAAATSTGVKSLPFTITDSAALTGTGNIALTVTVPPELHTIMEIQGHGGRSSFAGSGSTLGTTYVTTPSAGHTNVVTAVGAKGFFMQDIAGDGDPTTSDGVFVFTSTAPTVSVGDYVSVTGRIQEFSGSTEIAGTPSVTVISSGHVLPTPYDLSASLPTTSSSTGICMGAGSTINTATDGYQASNFACLDGMYIAISNGLVAAPGNGSGGDGIKADSIPKGFYATAGNPRGFREPGLSFDDTHIGGPTTGAGNPTYAGPIFDGNPEEFQVFMTGLNASFPYANYLYNAGQHFSLTGVIQGFVATGSTTITYETYPITLTTGAAPTYPIAVATSAPGKLTVGSQNGLHFFNNTADGADTTQYTDTCAGTGSNDTCPTLAQYQARLNKMSLQIRTVLKAPVVQVMQEVENYSVATDLANKIHADDASITYTPYLLQGNDPGGINLAILVRSGVTVNSVTQIYKSFTTTACSGSPPCLLNDRPPVLLDATYQGYHFRVLAIYDRSLLNLGVAGKDYVGQKRREQAEQVATIVQALQTNGATLAGAGNAQQASNGTVTSGSFDLTGDATVPVVVVGDFNAYEFTDGYVDVTGTIMGTVSTSQSASIYPPTASYVAPSPALFDTGTAANPADHYSYTFNGYAQEIDHILLTQRGQQDFIAISNAHGNADVSSSSTDVTDGTTARRVSDHDGQVVTLGFVVTANAGSGGSVGTVGTSTVQATIGASGTTFTFIPDTGYYLNTGSDTCGAGGSSSGSLNTSSGVYTLPSVSADCTVTVTFSNSYTLTYTAGANGTVDGQPSETQTVSYGSSGAAVTAIAATGYHFTQWSDARTDNPRTDSNVSANVSVTASFAINTYQVSPNVGAGGGSMNPSVNQTINYNSTATFQLIPQPGYHVANAYDNCGPSGANSNPGYSGGDYTTGPITADCTVSAVFYIDSYVVNATVSGSGGSVTPASQPGVTYNSTTTFTAVPDPGYSLASASGCGASAAGNTITTGPITSNCTVTLTFSANPINGTCGSDNGQTLLAAPTNLCSAGTATVVSGSGHPWTWGCNGSNGGTSTSATACSATIQTWTVSSTVSGGNGAVAPANQTVDNGSTTTFTATPNANYSLASVSGCGATFSGNTITTGAISANCTVTATFSANPVNGTCGSDNGQTLLATPVNLCSAGTASVVSGSGHPWTWSCSGTNGGSTASCSATIQTWTVSSAVSGGNGTVAPANQTVDNGKTTTFTASPNTNYSLASVSGCGATFSGNTITTGAISANCTVTATFSANPVNGVCGSDNAKTLSSTPVNLCSAGNPSAVAGSGPWIWTCQGTNGGTTASCSAALAPVVPGSIHVIGSGGSAINNGSTTPSVSNGTDLGTTPVGTPLSHSYSISNTALPPGSVSPTAVGAIATFGAAGGNAIIQAAGDLTIVSITSSNPAFTIAGGTGTIPAGGSATFTVTFTSAVPGPQTATITIVSNDPNTPVFTFVVGAAAQAVVIAPAVPAPALDERMLALLALLLAGLSYATLRKMSRS